MGVRQVVSEWNQYRYYEVSPGKFSLSECNRIIDLHQSSDSTLSQLYDHTGSKLRDSNLFWIRKAPDTAWIFERVEAAVAQYNKSYGFELIEQVDTAQLTRYSDNQQYGWHVDLGPNQASLRKVSVVVELTPQATRVGGGVEIFYGETSNNKVPLQAGDLLIFPSFVLHRASKVESGVRWSLVFWFMGQTPFR